MLNRHHTCHITKEASYKGKHIFKMTEAWLNNTL